MLLEDACIYIRVETSELSGDAFSASSDMIRCGVDVIELVNGNAGLAAGVAAACSEHDALCIIGARLRIASCGNPLYGRFHGIAGDVSGDFVRGRRYIAGGCR